MSTNALKAVDFTDRYYFTPARFAGKRGAGAPRRHARGAGGQEDRRRQGHRARGLPARVLPRQRHPRLRDRRAGARCAHHRRRRPAVRRRHRPGVLAERHRLARLLRVPGRPVRASPSTSATASASPSTARTCSSRRSSTRRCGACARADATRSCCCATSPCACSELEERCFLPKTSSRSALRTAPTAWPSASPPRGTGIAHVQVRSADELAAAAAGCGRAGRLHAVEERAGRHRPQAQVHPVDQRRRRPVRQGRCCARTASGWPAPPASTPRPSPSTPWR